MVEHRNSAHDAHEAECGLPDRPLAGCGEDAGHAAAWAAEIQSRVEELRSGKVRPISGERVFEELETLLR